MTFGTEYEPNHLPKELGEIASWHDDVAIRGGVASIMARDAILEEFSDGCPDCGCWPSNDVECRCPTTLWALDCSVGDG